MNIFKVKVSSSLSIMLLVIGATAYATQENKQFNKTAIEKVIPVMKEATGKIANAYNIPSWGFGINFNYGCIVNHPNPKFNIEFKNAEGEKKNCKIQVNHTRIGTLLHAGVDFNSIFFLGADSSFDFEKIKKDGIELGRGFSLDLSANEIAFALCDKNKYEAYYKEIRKEILVIGEHTKKKDISNQELQRLFFQLLGCVIKCFSFHSYNPVLKMAISLSNIKTTWIKLKNTPGSILIIGYSLEPIRTNLLQNVGSLVSQSKIIKKILTTLPAPCYIPAGGKIVAL